MARSSPRSRASSGAPQETVHRWREVLQVGGIDALRDMSKGGRPAQLAAAELSRLYVALHEGPAANGFSHAAVDAQASAPNRLLKMTSEIGRIGRAIVKKAF